MGLEIFGKNGHEVKVRCPYHDDRSPSAEFNTQSGLFYCFVCGVGKTAEQVAKDLGGEVSALPDREPFIERLDEPEISWRTRFSFMKLAIENEYLKTRLVPNWQVAEYGIREFDEGLAFPMMDGMNLIGFQARYYTRKPKYVFYGDRPKLYPMEKLGESGTRKIFLVEGVFGVLRGRLYGKHVFATLGSASLSDAVKIFFARERIIGLFDPDLAGYVAMAKLASIGISCAAIPFVPDEETEDRWIAIEKQVTMDVGFFIKKALNAGGSLATIRKQLLKFEKENSK